MNITIFTPLGTDVSVFPLNFLNNNRLWSVDILVCVREWVTNMLKTHFLDFSTI